ncbi:MAG: DNA polymerase III subunit gamma/tau [Bacteroidales bacterium]|nr:DNA polymerase III subunit gamma/tau [Bacteroidales bacterium]
MDKYIVSARKYRPSNFMSLVGQENIAVTLKNSIKRGQLAHAYLFCGPRGVGKTSTARIFAKTINCLNPTEDLEPCGKCESCLSFAEGRSYCIHELDAASNNSVDDIRQLTELVRIPPQVGRYSVYIIDEVHMLSAAAFNAFLKTLEEPPEYAIFILATTEKHKILPTILSRCQTYDFNRISIEDIVKNLTDIAQKENVSIDSESLHVIAQKADGAMRDALTLFDQCVAFCGSNISYSEVIKNLNVLDYEYYFRLTDFFLSGDFASALMLFNEILSKGFNALYFVGGLSTHFRDLMVAKSSTTASLLELSPSLTERYGAQAANCSLGFLFKALENTTACEAEYKQSGNPRLLVEFMLVKLSSLSPASQINNVSASRQITPVSAPQNTVATHTAATPVAKAQTATQTDAPQTVAPQAAVVQADNTMQQEKPAATEEPVREETRPSGGLSIKGILSRVQREEKPQTTATGSVKEQLKEIADKPLVQSELDVAWQKLAQDTSNPPRLASAVKKMNPHILDDGITIEFFVENAAQKSWMEKNKLYQYMAFLQKELSNSKIQLTVKIKEIPQQERKLYMPQEKAEYLLKNNPELVNLSKDLDLEIK